VGIVPLVAVGAANKSKAFRGDPLVRKYWQHLFGNRVTPKALHADQTLTTALNWLKLKQVRKYWQQLFGDRVTSNEAAAQVLI